MSLPWLPANLFHLADTDAGLNAISSCLKSELELVPGPYRSIFLRVFGECATELMLRSCVALWFHNQLFSFIQPQQHALRAPLAKTLIKDQLDSLHTAPLAMAPYCDTGLYMSMVKIYMGVVFT